MRIFYLLIIFLTIISCNPDDVDNNSLNINSYHAVFAQYGIPLSLSTNQDNLIKFKYDFLGRITKKTGDILYLSSNTGGGGYISNSRYTDLTYYSNKVRLVQGISGSDLTILPHEDILTINNQNKVSQKIAIKHHYSLYDPPITDTTNYTYANNGKLSYCIKTFNKVYSDITVRYFKESNFHYTNENLDSIVTISSSKLSDESYTIMNKKETEIFSSYDNALNPFKNLYFFEETFNRSLSKNNFSEYKKTSNSYYYPNNDYSQTSLMTPTNIESTNTWSFAYDQSGELIYNQF